MWTAGIALFWRLAGWVVPWATPRAAYGLAAALGAGLLVFFGYHLGISGKAEAVAQCDLRWIKQIGEQNHEFERDRTRARLAAARVAATPADRAERLRLCKASPTCRDGDQ